MKKGNVIVHILLMLIVIFAIPLTTHAEDINWEKLLEAVAQTESSGDENAIGDNGNSIGLCQISEITLKEFNLWALSVSMPTRINMTHMVSYSSGDEMKKGWYEYHIDYTNTDIRLYLSNGRRGLYTMGIMGDEDMMFIDNRNSRFLGDLPLRKENLYNKQVNETICIWYLRRLKYKYKCPDIESILASYNWGVGNVRKVKYNYKRYPKSVKRYIRKVMKLYQEGL